MPSIADRAVSMMIDLKTNVGQVAAPLKAAIATAGIGGLVAAFKSPEFRTQASTVFKNAGAQLQSAWAGAGASTKGGVGNFLGPGGMTAAGMVPGMAKRAWNFGWSTPGQMMMGGMLGGIPGAISAMPGSFGRMASSAVGGMFGQAVGGTGGGIGGALGGAMGGMSGALMGAAIGGTAGAIVGLGKAAMGAASTIASLVEMTDPYTAKEYNKAIADLQAIIGHGLKPIVEDATVVIRSWADTLHGMIPLMKGFASAVGEIMKFLFVSPTQRGSPTGGGGSGGGMSGSVPPVAKLLMPGPGGIAGALGEMAGGAAANWLWGPKASEESPSDGFSGGRASFSSIDQATRSMQLAAAGSGGGDPAERADAKLGKILIFMEFFKDRLKDEKTPFGQLIKEAMDHYRKGS